MPAAALIVVVIRTCDEALMFAGMCDESVAEWDDAGRLFSRVRGSHPYPAQEP